MGQTWTGLTRWLAEEYGVELHRSTIQRWYDREILDTSFDVDVLLDEAAANMADEISPEEEEDPETSITQTPSIGGAVLTNPG